MKEEAAGGATKVHLFVRRYVLWAVFSVVAIALAIAIYLCANVLRVATIDPDSRYVIVPQGATLTQIVGELHSRRIVSNPTALLLVARVTGIGTRLKAGGYRLAQRMSPYQVLQKIETGKIDLVRITIPEGFTIAQVARKLEEKRLCNAARFEFAAYQPTGKVNLPPWTPAGSLEGFLLPDTYYLPMDESEAEAKAILRMLTTFEKIVLRPLSAEIDRSSLSLKELVTLASLVEREAKIPRERSLIAGVLTKRLKKGMRLECDATVQYARRIHKERLLFSDLAIDSPYNTYLHAGLPPGPIANPGLASIEAALRPAITDRLFYVAKPDGSHVFSRTFAEHQRAIRRIRANKRTQRKP